METIKHKGYTIKIEQDTDAPNPREDDNIGTMYCEHRRYTLGDEGAENPFVEDEETGKLRLRKDVAVALPLYLYDHSGISMSVGSFIGRAPHAEWDSGQVGVIYATMADVVREYGNGDAKKPITKKMIEQTKSYLEGEVKQYDNYLRGNVYGYTCESPDGRTVGSCWGFYPEDDIKPWSFEKSLAYMIDEAKAEIDSDIESQKESEEMVKTSFAL